MWERFMDVSSIAQINLVFQVIIAAMLLLGFGLKKRNKFLSHGTVMLIALILNAVSIMLVMGPSLLGRAQLVEDYPLGKLSLAILGHAILGSVVEALGIWIVVSWHFRMDVRNCIGKKRLCGGRWRLGS